MLKTEIFIIILIEIFNDYKIHKVKKLLENFGILETPIFTHILYLYLSPGI